MFRFLFVLFFWLFLSCQIDPVIPPSSPKVIEGQKYFQNGDWDNAINSFREAIKNDSNDSQAYFRLAKSLKQKVGLNSLILKILNNNQEPSIEPNQNPFQKILNTNIDTLSTYLAVIPEINRILNTLYERDTSGKTDNRVPFTDVSIDFIATSFISLFIFPQDIDSNMVITIEDTSKIGLVLGEFKKSIENLPSRIVSKVKELVDSTIVSEDSTNTFIKIKAINTFNRLSSEKARQFLTALTAFSNFFNSSKIIEDLLNFEFEINSIANTLSYYQFFDGIDNDGDGCTDEEKLNGIDDDGDGFIDEDAGKYLTEMQFLERVPCS